MSKRPKEDKETAAAVQAKNEAAARKYVRQFVDGERPVRMTTLQQAMCLLLLGDDDD